MPDEQNAQPNAAETGTGTGNTQPAVRTFTQADLDRIAGQARDEGRRAALAEAERQRLEQQQEYQKLYEQEKARADALEPHKKAAEEAKATIKALVEAEIATLPEDMRGIVPDFEEPKRTLEWLTANKARLTRQPAPGTDAGARGDNVNPAAKLTPEDMDMISRIPGMTPERWLIQKAAIANRKPETK